MTPDPAGHQAGHQLVFVGGLHRSGTSLLAKIISEHPSASGLRGTGAKQDEGQFVQDVYDAANRHGGPGRFAFADEMHLTEDSPGCVPANADRLFACWAPYWDLSKHVLVEKSPPNLLKARYLQALFPGSAFVMLIRHPLAVGGANAKWSKSSESSLLRHWVVAHEMMAADLPHLERILLLRYEDLVADPQGECEQVFSFLGLTATTVSEPVRSGVNEAYFKAFESASTWARLARRKAISELAPRVKRFGYSLEPPYVPGALPADLQSSRG